MTNTKKIFIVLAILSTTIVFYLSWLPDPNIGLMPYFPKVIGEWTNKNGNVRTGVPFIFLGFFLEIAFSKLYKNWKTHLFIILFLACMVSIAELGQLFLPKRNFDLEDILWGLLGALLGILLGLNFILLCNKLNKKGYN